jgi:rhodanese-related sulfurtransferase
MTKFARCTAIMTAITMSALQLNLAQASEDGLGNAAAMAARLARPTLDRTTVKAMLAAAKADVPAISPAEAVKLVGQDNVLFVDVRDAPELAASGKVMGALNVSRGMLEFKADPASPMYDQAFAGGKQIVLYCASGGRAALAGQTLRAMGYTNVHNLGAFKDWKAAGGAVE